MRGQELQPDYWAYALDDGFEAWAGKTDADNDLLSLKVARPNELWFHVRGQPGSHVILRHPDGEKPANPVIKQAAAVAAWHSKARNAGTVPVSMTRAVNVTKQRGAPAGEVRIRREEVLKVRPGLP